MTDLSKTLKVLLPSALSDKPIETRKEKKSLEKALKDFANHAHQLDLEKVKKVSKDPTLVLLGNVFKREAQRAHQEFKSGHISYSKGIIRSLTTYCIHCHTRSANGPSFLESQVDPEVKKMSPWDQANYFAATRRFDKALALYQGIIKDKSFAKNREIHWERAVRKALLITIRWQKDPAKSLSLINLASQNGSLPFFLKQDLKHWQKSLKTWKAEPKRKAQTEKGLLAEAKSLFASATEKQKYPMDRSADMDFMRTTAAVHDLLSVTQSKKTQAEALYMAGVSYEVLRGLELWSLHELYYEMCINSLPHSPLARKCLERYQESIYSGYSGSGGTSIPSQVQSHIKTLEKKAR